MTLTNSGWLVAAALTLLAGCAQPASPPSTTAHPDHLPDEEGAVFDWEDQAKLVKLDGGWTVRACEGKAPLLCVERDGVPVGAVEALSYPLASFDGVDPDGDPGAQLAVVAAGFLEALATDRAAGCGPDYRFQPIAPRAFVLGNTPGLAYGYVGTMPDGTPAELNLQYSTVVGDEVVSIVAIAYDEGGCPGRDELSGFSSADLAAFRPLLERALPPAPLPDLSA